MIIDLIKGDCHVELQKIAPKSIDLVIVDPPYGTTYLKWDSMINLELIWEELKRITKPKAAIIFTASQPFTSILINSNLKAFRHSWVWQKSIAANFMNAKKAPLKKHEDIIVFGFSGVNYNPQFEPGEPYKLNANKRKAEHMRSSAHVMNKTAINNKGIRYPSSVQFFPNTKKGNIHPTQKPLDLMEYLIKTYSMEGDTVLDFTMGSGTTGVAAKNLGRSFIGIEIDSHFFNGARKRLGFTSTDR